MTDNRCPFCGSIHTDVIHEKVAETDDALPLPNLETPCYVLCKACLARGPVVMLDAAGGTTQQHAVDLWIERADPLPEAEQAMISI